MELPQDRGGQEEPQVKEEPVDSSSEEPTLQCKSEEGETEPDGTAIQIHRTVPVNAMPLAEYCWHTHYWSTCLLVSTVHTGKSLIVTPHIRNGEIASSGNVRYHYGSNV